MTGYVFDIVFVLIALTAAYLISRQGFVRAAASLVAVLVASQVAIGTFEAIVASLRRTFFFPADEYFTIYLWSLVAIGVFIAVFGGLSFINKTMLPDPPEMPPAAESLGSWITGLLGGYLVAAFLLTVAHTFPAPRDYWGAFAPERQQRTGPVLAFAPDYQFLALTEYVSDHASPTAEGKWVLDRPMNAAKLGEGRWSSFPIRFALWREKYEPRWQPFPEE